MLDNKMPLKQRQTNPNVSTSNKSLPASPSRTHTPIKDVQSKVREYILEVKKQDASSKAVKNSQVKTNTSLEDLYQISENKSMSPETAKKELRKTLRAVKEKDLIILQLRQTCQDLSIRCADAESIIDELRFKPNMTMKKSQSEINISNSTPKINMVDQATETKGDVLSESCSSWMEKVRNWKTADSTFNASADADSGFRGSDLENSNKKKSLPPNPVTTSTPKPDKIQTSTGTNTESQTNNFVTPKIRSQSYIDLHYTFSHTSDNPQNYRLRRVSGFDHFKTLDPLLADATAMARRVQIKSRRLAQIVKCVDKKV